MKARCLPEAAPQRGFSLIELMIAVVVVAILASVALPSFLGTIRKGRRAEAISALTAVQQGQERWRNNHAAYADNSALSTAPPAGLGVPTPTASGYYSISLSGTSSTDYIVTATAVTGKSQASDAGCQVMALRMQGGNLARGSGTSSVDWTDPNRCWAT